MAQSSTLGAVPASSGYNVRVNLNASDEALASENEGASAPGLTWPHMRWRDHASGLRYRRNAGNTAWVIAEAYAKTTDPGATDDDAAGYAAGSRWINTTAGRVFVCTDPQAGAAVWHTAETTGRIGTGTSFPGSPVEGDAFYRTDLDALFVYDATRSKWLGALESDGGGFNGDLAQNTYMRRFNGGDFWLGERHPDPLRRDHRRAVGLLDDGADRIPARAPLGRRRLDRRRRVERDPDRRLHPRRRLRRRRHPRLFDDRALQRPDRHPTALLVAAARQLKEPATMTTVYLSRDATGAITGVYAKARPGLAEEPADDASAEVQAYLYPPDLSIYRRAGIGPPRPAVRPSPRPRPARRPRRPGQVRTHRLTVRRSIDHPKKETRP